MLALSFLRASPYFSFLMATGWHAVPLDPEGQGRGTNAPLPQILAIRITTFNRIATCPPSPHIRPYITTCPSPLNIFRFSLKIYLDFYLMSFVCNVIQNELKSLFTFLAQYCSSRVSILAELHRPATVQTLEYRDRRVL